MIAVEISQPLGAMLFDGAFPKTEYGEAVQKLNAEGVPLWVVNVIVRQPDAKRSENLSVTVPAPADPSQTVPPFAPVAFEGLRIMTGSNGGKTWVSFAADRFGKAKG